MGNNDGAGLNPLKRAEQAEKHYQRLLTRNKVERGWINRRMQNDPQFHAMKFTKREHLAIGAIAMSWDLVKGQPYIRSLLKLETVSLDNDGFAYVASVVSLDAKAPTKIIIDHQPRYLEAFQAYLWVPAHADVQVRPHGEGGLTVPIAARVNHHIDSAPVDGRFFGTEKDFAERWPSFSF